MSIHINIFSFYIYIYILYIYIYTYAYTMLFSWAPLSVCLGLAALPVLGNVCRVYGPCVGGSRLEHPPIRCATALASHRDGRRPRREVRARCAAMAMKAAQRCI